MDHPDVRTPATRRTDPTTSHDAEIRATRSGLRAGHQRAVLDAVRKYPNCTSRELAQRAGLDRYAVARRLPELVTAGYVDRGSKRACSVACTPAVTWHPTPKQIGLEF